MEIKFKANFNLFGKEYNIDVYAYENCQKWIYSEECASTTFITRNLKLYKFEVFNFNTIKILCDIDKYAIQFEFNCDTKELKNISFFDYVEERTYEFHKTNFDLKCINYEIDIR